MKQFFGLALLVGVLAGLSGCHSTADASPTEKSSWSAEDSQEALQALRLVREQGRLLNALSDATAQNTQLATQMNESLVSMQVELSLVKKSLDGVEKRLDNFPKTETDRARVSAPLPLSQLVSTKEICGPNGCVQVAQAPAFNLFGGDFQDGSTPGPVDPQRVTPQLNPANDTCPGPNCSRVCTGTNCRTVSKSVSVSAAQPQAASSSTRMVSVSSSRPVSQRKANRLARLCR